MIFTLFLLQLINPVTVKVTEDIDRPQAEVVAAYEAAHVTHRGEKVENVYVANVSHTVDGGLGDVTLSGKRRIRIDEDGYFVSMFLTGEGISVLYSERIVDGKISYRAEVKTEHVSRLKQAAICRVEIKRRHRAVLKQLEKGGDPE